MLSSYVGTKGAAIVMSAIYLMLSLFAAINILDIYLYCKLDYDDANTWYFGTKCSLHRK